MTTFTKKLKAALAVGLAMTFLAVPASASALSSGAYDDAQTGCGGEYVYNVATGETTYIPPKETEAYSDETEGFSPGYNPYADEDNNKENLVEPYYLDSGRTRVNNPQNNPMCRNTVYIEVTYKNFKDETVTEKATGFMIGPNAVATAAHVVFKRHAIGNYFVGNATIIPAYNTGANSTPYGCAHATYFHCGGGWAHNGDMSDDWGIIELDTNIGNRTGWLGLQWKKSYRSGTTARVNGYPGTVNGQINESPATRERDQYFRMGTVKTSSRINMLESTDMFASRGDSGGPCYIYSSDTGYTAIGITSQVDPIGSDPAWNDINWVRFRQIDKSLFETLLEYRTSTL